MVAAASYEARKYGVRSAMPSILAKKKCENLIFVKPRFKRYKEISKKINCIFFDYTDLIEPLSLDEAFLDVTDNKKIFHLLLMLLEKLEQEYIMKLVLQHLLEFL